LEDQRDKKSSEGHLILFSDVKNSLPLKWLKKNCSVQNVSRELLCLKLLLY